MEVPRYPSAGLQPTLRPFLDSRMLGEVRRRPSMGYHEADSYLERSVSSREGIGPGDVMWGTQPPLGQIRRASFKFHICPNFSPAMTSFRIRFDFYLTGF